jgi:isocitrate lyase
MIAVVGNFNYLNEHFRDGEGDLIVQHCVDQLAPIFDLSPIAFQTKLNDYKKFMAHVNFPSKNVLYSMSKAFFFKYELNQYQDEYFRNMNTPNPIFLKSLDEVMRNFIWDWSAFCDKYKVQLASI